MQRIIRNIDNINADSFSLEHIRTATLVRLPFHLCTGSIFQILDPDDDVIRIWLRNKLSTPHDADIHEAWASQVMNQITRSSAEDFLTDALILNGKPELRPGVFEAIRKKEAGAIGLASPINPGFKLLNEVVAAHQIVRLGPYITGIGAFWPRMLAQREVFERIIVEVVLIVEPDKLISEDIILNLFENIDGLPLSLSTGGRGDLRDYSNEQMEDLLHAIRNVRNHAFYELKTNAIAAMLNDDSIVAIVLGCAALEGVHGAFIRLVMQDKIPGDTAEFNNFINCLLREQGFYSLVQLSVRVLIKPEECPSEDELKHCLEGVTIRNSIMHAGIKKTGKYKIRDYTSSQISDGYKGIMAVYRAFETAFESREKDRKNC